MPTWAWLLVAVGGLVVFVMLEGNRQERKYGRSGRGTMLRAGLMDLQRHLEPERKVEVLLQKKERAVHAESGEPPRAGED
jgi:hypothetical protein